MKIRPPNIILIVCLLLAQQHAFTQHRLIEGRNTLEYKRADFGKIWCKVVPEVDYSIATPGDIKIYFKGIWFDKNGKRITDPDNYIVLLDNVERIKSYYGKQNVVLVYMPKALAVKELKNIGIAVNGKKISYDQFNSGFVGCNEETEKPLTFTVKNINQGRTEIEIEFLFAYATDDGSKRTFREVLKYPLSWSFLLPESGSDVVNCQDIKSSYGRKLSDLSSSKDLNSFNALRKEIETKLGNCPDAKNDLLSEVDKYIQQIERDKQEKTVVDNKETEKPAKVEKRVKPVEVTVKKKEINWAEVENDYTTKIKILNSDYIGLKRKLTIVIGNISSNIMENANLILSMKKEYQAVEEIGPDQKEILRNKYNDLVSTNNYNRDQTNKFLDELQTFIRRLNNLKSRCKLDLINIEEDEGSKKFKHFEEKFDAISNEISKQRTRLRELQNQIESNNNEIIDLRIITSDEEGEKEIKRSITYFDTIYGNYCNEIEGLNMQYLALKNNFEEKRYSRWYFKSTKKRFLTKTNDIYSLLFELQKRDSTTKIEKESTSFVLNIPNLSTPFERTFDDSYYEVKSNIDLLRSEIQDWQTQSFPYLYIVLLLVVIAILGFGARIYFKALKTRAVKSRVSKPVITTTGSEKKTSSGGITITQSLDKPQKGKGLFEVKQNAGTDFLELDLGLEWEDTLVKKVYFGRECIIKTYRFFEDSIRNTETGSTANETGGYMIGRWDSNIEDPDKFDVSLEDFVEPGDDATFSSHQLNFGAKISVKLQKTIENWKQKKNIEMVMTAWFHSHPGLKIFLSDFDLSVQKDFSGTDKKLRMLALVIDPYTEKWETGIFSYKVGASMNNSMDSKQFFSLDEMYRWALNTVDNSHENYFSALLSNHYKSTIVDKIYFTNSCILEIKRNIEDNITKSGVNDILCYIGGHKTNNLSGSFNIIFEGLLENDKSEHNYDQILGCIIKSSNEMHDTSGIISKLDQIKEGIQIILAYNHEDNSILPISKDQTGVFNKAPGSSAKLNFDELINWTRKRN